jgi:hypothetical protein
VATSGHKLARTTLPCSGEHAHVHRCSQTTGASAGNSCVSQQHYKLGRLQAPTELQQCLQTSLELMYCMRMTDPPTIPAPPSPLPQRRYPRQPTMRIAFSWVISLCCFVYADTSTAHQTLTGFANDDAAIEADSSRGGVLKAQETTTASESAARCRRTLFPRVFPSYLHDVFHTREHSRTSSCVRFRSSQLHPKRLAVANSRQREP